jgi:hypothetical protein
MMSRFFTHSAEVFMALFLSHRSESLLLPSVSWKLSARSVVAGHIGAHPKAIQYVTLVAAAGMMWVGVRLALTLLSAESVALGASTLLGTLALLQVLLLRLPLPAAANWPWLGLTSILLGWLLPELLLQLINSVTFGWLLLVILAGSVLYTLCSQLLLFDRPATLIAWNMLLCLPLSALCLSQTLEQPLASSLPLMASPAGLFGVVVLGAGYWWFWAVLLRTDKPVYRS